MSGRLDALRQLFAHVEWADGILLAAIRGGNAPAEAVREYAHILGADEVWLARIQGRASRQPVWPELSAAALEALAGEVHRGYRAVLDGLTDAGLGRVVAYTNTAGKAFETVLHDILVHVVLHAQYHRGKINLLLRQAGLEPAPADYIAFVRGAAAAVTPRNA